MRAEYGDYWDFRICLDVPAELSLVRGIDRGSESEGRAESARLHRDRHHESERIYISEVDPVSKADVIVDNADFASPSLIHT